MKEEKTKCGNTSQSQTHFRMIFGKKSKNQKIILSFFINHLFFTGGSGK